MGSLFDGGRQMEGTMYVGADGILWFSIDRERSYYLEFWVRVITPRFWLSRELAKAFSKHFSNYGGLEVASGVSIRC